jgi:hypothetical protein
MKLIILVQRHEGLYNLQHKDYDNSLVKDNRWKEIVGELHCAVGEWQGSGRVAAGERHGMCELAFNVAGERHGMCESAFIRQRQSVTNVCLRVWVSEIFAMRCREMA